MIIKTVPIDSIHLYPGNPREIEESQFNKLIGSIKEFGLVEPLIVNTREDPCFVDDERVPTVIGGNMRWRALKKEGYEDVDIVEVNLNRSKEAVLNIALNRISGKWDIEKLEKMVYDLSSEDLDIDISLSGLEDWELKLYNPGFVENDYKEIWDNMPEFKDKGVFDAFRSITIHFENQESVDNFAELVKQGVTEKTKYLWHPRKKRRDLKSLEIKSEE